MPERKPRKFPPLTKGKFKRALLLFGQTLIIEPIAHSQDLSRQGGIQSSSLANLEPLNLNSYIYYYYLWNLMNGNIIGFMAAQCLPASGLNERLLG